MQAHNSANVFRVGNVELLCLTKVPIVVLYQTIKVNCPFIILEVKSVVSLKSALQCVSQRFNRLGDFQDV